MSVAVCSGLCCRHPFRWQWTAQLGEEKLTITLATNEGKVTAMIALEGGGETPIEWGMVKGDLTRSR